MKEDSVDLLLHQWHQERPDLDPWPSSIAARIFRLTVHLRKQAEEWLASMDLSWEVFEILMALRRSGAPFEMKPTALYKATLRTSGARTNRLDRAEDAGLIARSADPTDRRGVIVRLTPAGMKLADAAATRYFDESSARMGHLAGRQRKELADLLRMLLSGFEGGEEAPAEEPRRVGRRARG
jgi:DNA-binding MarR family transcriptional regulator